MKKCLVIVTIVYLCINLFACQTPSSEEDVFEYEISNGSITINRYLGSNTNIVIPPQLDNLFVQKIGTDAFYQCVDIESISLPETITVIDSSAFYRCYSLTKIKLTKNLTTIGNNPFFRCSSLETIAVDEENMAFSAVDGVLFNKERTKLIIYPEGKKEESFSIPDSVTSISEDAFGYKTNLKTIHIPSSVTKLPGYNLFVYPDEITLKVHAGSMAEQYAQEYGINYILE